MHNLKLSEGHWECLHSQWLRLAPAMDAAMTKFISPYQLLAVWFPQGCFNNQADAQSHNYLKVTGNVCIANDLGLSG